MTFEVEVAGRVRTVVIDRVDRPGRYRVLVDGEAQMLDVIRTSEYGLSVLIETVRFPPTDSLQKRTAGTGSRDLHVTPGGQPGELFVYFEGRHAPVAVNGRRTGHFGEAAAHGHGDIAIIAPMPGRVVRVLVQPGDQVSARQGVVVVEAMKMENELRAPRAGRLKEIAVQPGASVEAGRILAVIE